MNKYTVLTYIIGNYEKVHELNFDPSLTPHVEYLLVTDIKDLKSNTWTVVYDEELDKPELLAFDRVFHIRYNLFKYTNNDIVVRLDGSIGVNRPLDDIVSEFINGNYDGCINIHPGRDSIIDECFTWCLVRGFPPINSLYQINYIQKAFGYDFNKRGLIELNISINKRGYITNEIDNNMQRALIAGNIENFLTEKKDDNKHFTRLDQTIFTAFINTFYSDKKWMFVNDSLFREDGPLSWYCHNSDNRMIIRPETFIDSYFNGQKVEVKKF